MPLYEYHCGECKKEFDEVKSIDERYEGKCPDCGGKGEKLISLKTGIEVFKPMVYRDICETPLLISSKKQLREECKKHDVVACRLM